MPFADCHDREADAGPHGPRGTVEYRIEQARGRMALGFSRTELTRELAAEWGLARRTVRRYLDRAERRNRELVRKAPADALADSLTFWRGLLLDAMNDRAAARADLADALAADKTGRIVDCIARRAGEAEQRAATYRDRIDRLLGLLSPAATADRLTVAGAGGAASRPPEPSDPERTIRDLLEAAGVVAEPVSPTPTGRRV